MGLNLRWSARSEVGLVREGNEDSGYAGSRLLAVADGMGGMVAGDLASALTIGVLRRLDDAVADDVVGALRLAVLGANDRLRVAVEADPGLEGMGTTVTALLWDGSILGLAHIGDSRGYLWRDGRLERLTHDHTFVQSLVDEGRITEAEARVHPHRSLLLRALDGRSEVDLDTARLEIAAGDRFLLCSDGLCGYVEDPLIAEALAIADRDAAVDALIDRALLAGGPDNVTCLVADAVEVGSPADVAGDHALAGTAPTTSQDDPARVDDPPGHPGQRGLGRGARDGSHRVAVLIGAAAVDPVLPPELVAALAQAEASAPDLPAGGGLRRRGGAEVARRGGTDGSRQPSGAGPGTAGRLAVPGDTDAGGDAGGTPLDEEDLRYAPQHPWRFRWIPRLLVVLLVVAGAMFGAQQAWAWSQQQYYVGASNGQVAIFRGLPEKLLGISLSSVYVREGLTVTTLPPYYRQRVEMSLSAGNLATAQSVVGMLQTIAQHCQAVATDRQCRSGGPLTGLPGSTPGPAPSPATTGPTTPVPTTRTSTPASTARASTAHATRAASTTRATPARSRGAAANTPAISRPVARATATTGGRR